MPPFFVDDVKIVMVYQSVFLLPANVDRPIRKLSKKARCPRNKNGKKTREILILGYQVLRFDMLALPGLKMNKRNILLFAKRLNPAAETASITHHGSIRHIFVAALH